MVESSFLLSVLSWSLASASIILSVARRTVIASFMDEVLDRNRQPEWFDVKPIPLLNKDKAYRLVQMMPYKTDLSNWGKQEYFARASETIEKEAGDCDDKAILLASLWYGMGMKPVVVIADTNQGGHAFIEMDGHVYDPTWDVWETPLGEYYEKHEVAPSFWFSNGFWGGFP